jgi:small redox-active disulfide protein 2
MKIEILGSGCAKCKETEKHVGEALGRAGVQADVVHINDIKEISRRGVFFTPALAIDGQVKISGRVPSVDEIAKLLV